MKTAFFVFLFSLISMGRVSPLSADAPEGPVERLSLSQCVARALANSHLLAAERHRLEALDAEIKQLYWTPFSSFFIEGLFTLVPDRCIDEQRLEEEGVIADCGEGNSLDPDEYKDQSWGPRLSFKAGFDLPLYTFGKIASGARAAKAAEKAKEAELPRFGHKVRFQVEQAYNAISGAREMLYTIDKGREYLAKARSKIEQDLENQEGTSTQIDLIKIQVFEEEITQYEAQAREIERVGLAALRVLVGGSPKKPVDILDTPQEQTSKVLLTLDAYKSAALDRRPELAALRHAVAAMEAKVDYRRAEFWPDFFLSGRFGGAKTPGVTDLNNWVLNDNFNYGPGFVIGVGLRYKLDLGQDIYRLRQAKAELAALTMDQRAALDGIMLEVARAYHHATAAGDALQSMQRSKKLVKGWLSAVLQNHAIGLATAKDVKEALTEYFKVMASLHKLTHDYNVSMAELDRVTGAPLKGTAN